MKKLLLVTAMTLVALPALAQVGPGYAPRADVYGRDYPETTGSLGLAPPAAALPRSSADTLSTDPAADGNARELTKPTQNYGNVSGGYLAR